MMSDYERILRENLREYGEGIRHLAFLGRLYADRTHFIFELLQNAEDAKATKIQFRLLPDRLEVRHDGRLFNEKDVRGVCGVGEGTGADDLTRIGKFGIGFKSVYAYTSSPEIHSGAEHFRIERFIRPYACNVSPLEDCWTTLFIFAFSHPEVPPDQAFQEIGVRLTKLGCRTLLFLRHIGLVQWLEDGRERGCYLREVSEEGSARIVRVLNAVIGDKSAEEWILFDREVKAPQDDAKVKTEIAFRLEAHEPEGKRSIVRISDAPLVVFFPTDKKVPLGFLLQGPYRTTPARDNVPEQDSWNQLLVEETAELLVEALSHLRDMGLLTVSLLEAMPVVPANFPAGSMFRSIYDKVRTALRDCDIWPTYKGGYTCIGKAKLARGSDLLDLFSAAQLKSIFGTADDLQWLSAEITESRVRDLYRFLVGYSGYRYDPEAIAPLIPELEVRPDQILKRLTSTFMDRQQDSWVAKFYSFLANQRDLWPQLRPRPFIRLQNGTHVAPFQIDGVTPCAYLPGPEDSSFPSVKREVLIDEKARTFLNEFGLREPDVVADVIESVLPRYLLALSPNSNSLEQHRKDVHKILRALGTDSKQDRDNLIRKLRTAPILRASNVRTGEQKYLQPEKIYADNPNMRIFFESNPEGWVLDACYTKEEQKELCRIGVATTVRIRCKKTDDNGYVILSANWGHHKRGIAGFDPACEVFGLDFAVKHPTPEKSAFIWNELLVPNRRLIRGIVESSNRQNYEGSVRREQWTKTGELLRDANWLPDKNGGFFKPVDLSLDDLPDAFERNDSLATALGMKHTSLTRLAAAAGVDVDDIELIRAHPQEFAKFRDVICMTRPRPENPINQPAQKVIYAQQFATVFERPQLQGPDPNPIVAAPPTNPERYQKIITEEIEKRRKNEPPAELRVHIASRAIWEDKDNDARIFLKEEYGGHCQICDATFFKRDGEPYFEGVYLVSYTQARWIDNRGNVLCLCPTCAAKFLYGSVEAEDIQGQMQTCREQRSGMTESSELRVRLCDEDKIIRFTSRHLKWLIGLITSDE